MKRKKYIFSTFVSVFFLKDGESDEKAKALIFRFIKNLLTQSVSTFTPTVFELASPPQNVYAIELSSSVAVSADSMITRLVNEIGLMSK